MTCYQHYYVAFGKDIVHKYALLRLLENWRSQLGNKNIIGTILCDLSKAFDTLPHDLIGPRLETGGTYRISPVRPSVRPSVTAILKKRL